MPHYICRWPSGDVLLASVESRQELDAILQEKGEPGACKVARYHGPMVLELKPKLPGCPQASAARFKTAEPSAPFAPLWSQRGLQGDLQVLAADGSAEPAHRSVLQCRMPPLQTQQLPTAVQHVRISAITDRATLLAFLEFVYLDEVAPAHITHHLHLAALRCQMRRLADVCEAHFAARLESQLSLWPSLAPTQQCALVDALLDWARYSDTLGRKALRGFCVHCVARHLDIARGRPGWQRIQPTTARLIEVVAISMEQPAVERHIESSDRVRICVVQLESELYAHAGGRMTEAEWQLLHTYRAAVRESQALSNEACPLLVTEQELASSGLTCEELPHLPFDVKLPVLGAQRRLMDSVARFTYPNVYSAIEDIRQERLQHTQLHEGHDEQNPQQQHYQPRQHQHQHQQQQQPIDEQHASQLNESSTPLVRHQHDDDDRAAPNTATQTARPTQPTNLRASADPLWGSGSAILAHTAQQISAAQQQELPAGGSQVAAFARRLQQHLQQQQNASMLAEGPSRHSSWASGSTIAHEAHSEAGTHSWPHQQQQQQQQRQQQQQQQRAVPALFGSSRLASQEPGSTPWALPANLHPMRHALVQDTMLYDDSLTMKQQLAQLVVAAELGDPNAAELLLDGDVSAAGLEGLNAGAYAVGSWPNMDAAAAGVAGGVLSGASNPVAALLERAVSDGGAVQTLLGLQGSALLAAQGSGNQQALLSAAAAVVSGTEQRSSGEGTSGVAAAAAQQHVQEGMLQEEEAFNLYGCIGMEQEAMPGGHMIFSPSYTPHRVTSNGGGGDSGGSSGSGHGFGDLSAHHLREPSVPRGGGMTGGQGAFGGGWPSAAGAPGSSNALGVFSNILAQISAGGSSAGVSANAPVSAPGQQLREAADEGGLPECNIRRITCHGLMTLCAALAPSTQPLQQEQQHVDDVGQMLQCPEAGSVGESVVHVGPERHQTDTRAWSVAAPMAPVSRPKRRRSSE